MKLNLFPAVYRHPQDDYKCNICGWEGYPDATEGWCPTERIPCPECGFDVTEEVDSKAW